MAPTTTKQWTVDGTSGFESLKFDEKSSIPLLGDHDVLVHFYYTSLNYRDLIIPKVKGPLLHFKKQAANIPQGKYVFWHRDHVVPGSDGAGVVEAIGTKVSRFKPGDKVVTLFNQEHIGGLFTKDLSDSGLGGCLDGTLRQYGAFNEQGLVVMPSSLDFKQASTLSCAAVTAWNSLYGLESRALKKGETILTQGTGGVSIFALQVCPHPDSSTSVKIPDQHFKI